MVWRGMVWYGVVWRGMVWYGVVWCGLGWFVWFVVVWKIAVCQNRPPTRAPELPYGRSARNCGARVMGRVWDGGGMVICGMVVWYGMEWKRHY